MTSPAHLSHWRQFMQFLVVGGTNAIIDIGSLNLMLRLWPTTNMTLLISFNTLAYILAIINSYIWNSRYTFRAYAKRNLRETFYFFLQAGLSLILSNLTFVVSLHLLEDIELPMWLIQNISKVMAMAVPSTASFLFMKYFVFRHKPHRE